MQIKFLKKNILKVKFSTLFALSAFFVISRVAFAEELIITGNGSGSTNDVAVTANQTANITQNNEIEAETNLNTTANTGGNNTNNNSGGESVVKSGNISTEVNIENSANLNTIDNECCNGNSTNQVLISGNGAISDNSINIISFNSTSLNAASSANITNLIFGSVNTGNNTASDNNNGNVTIKTGSIKVSENVSNGSVNFTDITSSLNSKNTNDYKVNISGNGGHTNNKINLNIQNNDDVNIINAIDILNESVWLLNSGNNYANNNAGGKVNIFTGDINFLADIVNGPINVNKVNVECCEPVKEQPTGGVTPITPPSIVQVESKPSENKSSDGAKPGEVLAAAVGSILPATGNYNFMLFIIGNTLMLLLGMVLRLRSGRSPNLINVVA